MNYVSSTPSHPLGNFVERLWEINDSPRHFRERIVPSGTIELVVNLKEDEFRIYDSMHPEHRRRFSGAMVSGTYASPFVIDARQHALVVGVHFRPAGAFPFLGAAANELADTHVDLETLWGYPARELRERLCVVQTPAERFRLLEQALLNHLFCPMEHHSAVLFALSSFMRADSDQSVREVARKVGLSHRRFIQVFAREVGLSPKLFCRVRRFQQTLALTRQTSAPNWSQLAWEGGYFDQAHLIHDFRLFSDLSPTEYLRQRSGSVIENHVPVVR